MPQKYMVVMVRDFTPTEQNWDNDSAATHDTLTGRIVIELGHLVKKAWSMAHLPDK